MPFILISQMFALVLLFGLFHGLIFLPVLLSLIGPQEIRSSNWLKNDVHDNGEIKSNPYDNNAFQNMEKGSNPVFRNEHNSKTSTL